MTTHQERNKNQARLVCEFLATPHSRRIQAEFVELCIRLTEVCIRRRLAYGLKLPVQRANIDAGIRDWSVDTIETLLCEEKKKPFAELFDFYRKRGITDFKSADPDMLLALLKMVITNHARQELYDLVDKLDPQRARLKRRLKDILKSPGYREWKSPDDISTLVGLVDPLGGLRGGEEIISYHTLMQLVEESYHNHGISRTEWCRAVFNSLDEMLEHRNCCRKYELIGAVIAVNLRYVDMEGVECASLAETESGLMLSLALQVKQQALELVRDNGLRNFVQNGKLDQQTAEKFLLAADCYLIDLINSGADKLPVYFREVMPESEHGRYRADYKHMFETVIKGAVKHFRNLM